MIVLLTQVPGLLLLKCIYLHQLSTKSIHHRFVNPTNKTASFIRRSSSRNRLKNIGFHPDEGAKGIRTVQRAKMITVPRKSKTNGRRRELTTFETTSVADTRGAQLFLRRREGEREGREWRRGASEAIGG